MGWFFGLKLHLTFNERGEIISFLLSPGHAPDNNQALMLKLTEKLTGKLYADKGYIGHELFLSPLQKGVHLITGIRRNMKNHLMSLWDKLMLRKRSIIETINDQLKNTQQIKHTQDTAGLKKLEVKLKKTSRKLNSVHIKFELFKNAMLERSNQNKDNPKYIAIKEFINNL